MYPLLILRCEALCLVLLIYLICTGRLYELKKDNACFTRLSAYALAHVVFDIITVETVNRLDETSFINNVCHLLFYITALLFSFELLHYTLEHSVSKKTCRTVRIAGYVIIGAYTAVSPFLGIEYLQCAGTKSSSGPVAYVGYGIALCCFLVNVLLILVDRKRIPGRIKTALLPMILILITCEVIQMFVRELLFTGSALTIVAVGFFFSLENPAEIFRRKLQFDTLTGVKSRHSYEDDIRQVEKTFSQDKNYRFALIFCDLNNLKGVNDLFGHEEGDAYITGAAAMMMETMKTADSIYRMGGDEFMALYTTDVSETAVKQEIAAFNAACAAKSAASRYPYSVAVGYAISGPDYASVRDVLRVADYLMYKNKAEIKKERAYLTIGPDREKLNISGLTDRVFEAFARTSMRNYFFVCNMETNVTRLSPHMLEYFGFDSEFVYNFGNLWVDYVHPEDQDLFRADDMKIFTGKRTTSLLEYRVRNKEGNYVVCTCRGSVLKGTRGEPDLYAGTIENHGIADDIDPVTGLHNDDVFIRELNGLIEARTAVALLRISIMDFSRINMLYGFSGGNDLMRQFAIIMQRVTRGSGVLYRLNGTNFVACLPGKSRADVGALYGQLQAKAAEGISVQNLSVPIQIAGGAYMLDSMFDGSATSVYSSLIYAHDRSEHSEHGRLVYYNDPAETGILHNYKLLSRVHTDVLNGITGFFMRYQPIVSTDTHEVRGVEALLRWKDDFFGEVLPDRFVPWLENDPCFLELGEWILAQAMNDTKRFLTAYPDLKLHINITAIQLRSNDFHGTVRRILDETGFPADHLFLEFTGQCYGMPVEQLRELIKRFHDTGIRIALDNVTVHDPAIGALLELPIDEIKLDRDFVKNVPVRQSNQVLLKMLLEASRSLGFNLCFEGIEDSAAHEYFKQFIGTDFQGFYNSIPMTSEEFENQN